MDLPKSSGKEERKDKLPSSFLQDSLGKSRTDLSQYPKMPVKTSLGDVPLYIRNRLKETRPLLEESFPISYQSLINKVKKRFD